MSRPGSIATYDEIWAYCQLPAEQRVSLRLREQCDRPQCPNLLRPVVFDSDLAEPGPDDDFNDTKTVKDPSAELKHMDSIWCYVDEVVDVDPDTKEYKKVERRVRQFRPVTRKRQRLLCTDCRQVLYCSKNCQKIDYKYHRRKCVHSQPNDILQCVVLEDVAGVEQILEQDPTQAIRQYGHHSILEYAKHIGEPSIIELIQDYIDTALALKFSAFVMSETLNLATPPPAIESRMTGPEPPPPKPKPTSDTAASTTALEAASPPATKPPRLRPKRGCWYLAQFLAPGETP